MMLHSKLVYSLYNTTRQGQEMKEKLHANFSHESFEDPKQIISKPNSAMSKILLY